MKALLIIAHEGYQDQEYEDTRIALEKGDVQISIASLQGGEAHGKFGGSAKVDKILNEVNIDNYDAIVFIGGPGAIQFQHDPEAHRIAKQTQEKEKVLAAICIAPTILAFAGVLHEKKATVWDDGDKTQIKILEDSKAEYKEEDIVIDGKLITANGPHAATQFGQTILKKLTS